eukprot:446660_1
MHMARTTSLQSTLLLCIIFIQRFFIIASDCNGNCNHHDDLQNTWCCIKHIATATLSDIPNYVNGVSDVIQIKWFLNGACALFAALFVSLMDFLKYRDKFTLILFIMQSHKTTKFLIELLMRIISEWFCLRLVPMHLDLDVVVQKNVANPSVAGTN